MTDDDFIDAAAVQLMPLAVQVTAKPGAMLSPSNQQVQVNFAAAAAVAYQIGDLLNQARHAAKAERVARANREAKVAC